jgi:D-arabinose 1-dehydrogenase-like Zn-dependent alcohol dehydrogenase
MPKMKITVVPKPGVDFEVQEHDIPQPPAGQVRIDVQALGPCHSLALLVST